MLPVIRGTGRDLARDRNIHPRGRNGWRTQLPGSFLTGGPCSSPSFFLLPPLSPTCSQSPSTLSLSPPPFLSRSPQLSSLSSLSSHWRSRDTYALSLFRSSFSLSLVPSVAYTPGTSVRASSACHLRPLSPSVSSSSSLRVCGQFGAMKPQTNRERTRHTAATVPSHFEKYPGKMIRPLLRWRGLCFSLFLLLPSSAAPLPVHRVPLGPRHRARRFPALSRRCFSYFPPSLRRQPRPRFSSSPRRRFAVPSLVPAFLRLDRNGNARCVWTNERFRDERIRGERQEIRYAFRGS